MDDLFIASDINSWVLLVYFWTWSNGLTDSVFEETHLMIVGLSIVPDVLILSSITN